jgi:hypothetical protein
MTNNRCYHTMPLTFALRPLRFVLRAEQPVHFPPGKAANVLRGGFGIALRECAPERVYQAIFEPRAAPGAPSGFGDPPRPFVFRAAHLDGRTVACGDTFYFDVNLFDTGESMAALFGAAFRRLGETGLGPGRGRAALVETAARENPPVVEIDLAPGEPVESIRVAFLTPTELKGADRPEFGALFARVRDRIGTLRALYGAGPLAIDFRAIGERAARVEMVRADLRHESVERRSSRTGQSHPLGGFTGSAEYRGALGEFVPWLRAAAYTGVGRQTVWGKGAIAVLAQAI